MEFSHEKLSSAVNISKHLNPNPNFTIGQGNRNACNVKTYQKKRYVQMNIPMWGLIGHDDLDLLPRDL